MPDEALCVQRPATFGSGLAPAQLLRFLPSRKPNPRLLAKIAAIATAIVAGLIGILYFTPLAHPRDLQVQGAAGVSASKIRAAVEEVARGQSTFNVDESALMRAVAAYPEVAAVDVQAHPPFRLDLTVVMRPPVARVQIGGQSFVVAGDGTVLRRAAEATVPRIDRSISSLRVSDGAVSGGRGALTILAAAPEPLLGLARTIRAGSSGLEIVMQRGPRLIFGNATSAADKWAAAATVLADGAAARGTYIDLRVPSRPAVGGLGGSRVAGAIDPPSLSANPGAGSAVVSPARSAGIDAAAAGDSVATAGTGAPATGAGQGTGANTAPAAGGADASPVESGSGEATAPGESAPGAAEVTAPSGGANVTGGATP